MKVIHFNTASSGGAAILMLRLHRALRQQGHDSQVRFRHGELLEESSALKLEYCTRPLDRLLERGRYSFENRLLGADPLSYFSRSRLHRKTPLKEMDLENAVIHLHWVGRWLDLPSFMASLPPQVPIVWTIHDMSPLAGGCFLDFGCEQYDKACACCPLLPPPFDRFLASSELRRRQRALAGRRVAVVANSASTRRLVERSSVFAGVPRHTIHPGVDFSTLQREEKREAKKALRIHPDRLVLGFGAASLTDRNKGIDRFLEVAAKVARDCPETEVLLFGEGEPAYLHPGPKVHHLGRISSPQQLSQAMSAMDAFVITSRMETFGQVAVEAQACGTPVWAFAVGGVPETLMPGESGGLFPYGNTDLMAADIVACHREGRLPGMGTTGALWVRDRFGSDRTTQHYVELYHQLLNSDP